MGLSHFVKIFLQNTLKTLDNARAVMRELYEYAQKDSPEFFPGKPIEKFYVAGRNDWRDLLWHLRNKATIAEEGNRIIITLSKDMQPWEVKDYEGYLPQTVKYKRTGNTLSIENPKEFYKWLGQPPPSRNPISRLFTRLLKRKDT